MLKNTKRNVKVALTIMLISSLVLTLIVGCTKTDDNRVITKDNIKIGLITLHDDSSTYDLNFIEAMYRALENLGISKEQLSLTTGVDETEDCYNEAKRMATAGCDVIFGDSFGHESWLIMAAEEFPNVKFAHATGTQAHTAGLDNFSNAFASIYEGRYVAGVVAGLKLQEMIDSGAITPEQAVVGYVGAFPYAEVKSGYTAWYLGVRSVVSSATMVVRFTGSWYDPDLEYSAAKSLIDTDKCVLISQHADSMGAPNACEESKVPNVSYNGSTENAGRTTYLVASKIDWTPYFEYIINQTIKGEKIDTDWTGTFATGSVVVLDASNNCVAGTADKITETVDAIKAGTLNIFDTSKFTVGGQTLTSYKADVDTDEKWEKDTEVISGGIFMESYFRSAPYFDIDIDGITIINK